MPSSLIGSLVGLGLGSFGDKPKVPELTPVSTDAAQKQAIAGNQASMADIAKLATSYNTLSQDQLDMLIDRTLPGARQQIQKNIASQLRGEIPEDVQRAIYRGVAERTAGGNAFGGGGFTHNVTARDLGLTSLDITQKGLSSAESWLSKAQAPMFDATSMMFTPQQRLAQANLQQERQYQRDLAAAGVAAAPDPGMAALGQGFDATLGRAENAAFTIGGLYAAGGGLGGNRGGWSGGLLNSSSPSGWGGLSNFQQDQYLNSARQGMQAGWGQNFE